MLKNSHDGCRAYGRFVGERFGDLDNILWSMGGDRDPGDLRLEVDQMAEGIREDDPRHPMTAHCAPESVPADLYCASSWLDVNNTYSYGIVHGKLYAAYRRVPTMPFFLMESSYENEQTASEVQLRRQAYWSVLRASGPNSSASRQTSSAHSSMATTRVWPTPTRRRHARNDAKDQRPGH